MSTIFSAGVVVHLVDRVSSALASISRSFATTNTAAQALCNRLRTISSLYQNGRMIIGGGVALASPLISATKSAMHLQSALSRVQMNTNASNAEMIQLNKTLSRTANMTGVFSKVKLAGFASSMAEAGVSRMSQINSLLPLMAKAADLTQFISHGKITADQSAHVYTALAHQFGAYSASAMKPIIEAAVAMSTTLPGGLRTLQGMGAYTNIPAVRQLGITPIRAMELAAALAQTSGGRGTGKGALSGAQLANFLTRSMPGVFGSGLLSGRSAFAAEVIGLSKGGVSTAFKNGKLSIDRLSGILTKFMDMPTSALVARMRANLPMLGKKAGEESRFLDNFVKAHGPKAQLITKLLQSEYGSASTIAQLFADSKFRGLLSGIQNRVNSFPGIEPMQAKFMANLEPQLLRLQTNFETLSATIGMHMIPVLTPLISRMGDFLDKLNTFAVAHPRIVRAAVGLTALASGALILGGAALIARAGIMGLQFVLMPLVVGPLSRLLFILPSFVPALSGVWRVVTALARGSLVLAAVLGAVAIVTDNWDRIMGFVHAHWKLWMVIAAQIAKLVNGLVIAFKHLGNAIQTFFETLSASLPDKLFRLPESWSQGLNKFMTGILPKVNDVEAKSAERYLRTHGYRAVADTIHKPRLSVPTQSHKIVQTNNVTNNITVTAPPGGNAKDMAATIQAEIARGYKDLTRKAQHAANAASGNSVGHSIFAGGNTRP